MLRVENIHEGVQLTRISECLVFTMMTSSNGKILRVTDLCAENSPDTGEFSAQRPMTRSFDVFFELRLNSRLSKQSWGWWFEKPSRSLWRHCNALPVMLRIERFPTVAEGDSGQSPISFMLFLNDLTLQGCSSDVAVENSDWQKISVFEDQHSRAGWGLSSDPQRQCPSDDVTPSWHNKYLAVSLVSPGISTRDPWRKETPGPQVILRIKITHSTNTDSMLGTKCKNH